LGEKTEELGGFGGVQKGVKDPSKVSAEEKGTNWQNVEGLWEDSGERKGLKRIQRGAFERNSSGQWTQRQERGLGRR